MSNPELTHTRSRLDTQARALVRATSSHSATRTSAAHKLARGLGWFSVALGLVELLAAPRLARRIGLSHHTALLQVWGARELVTGVGILTARQPDTMAAWVRARVGGDALDLATLACARGGHPAVAAVAVAGVTALDVACASTLQAQAHAARQTTDFSNRVGMPLPADQMRGKALETFEQPADMRVAPERRWPTLH
jgi:hypothetical protein